MVPGAHIPLRRLCLAAAMFCCLLYAGSAAAQEISLRIINGSEIPERTSPIVQVRQQGPAGRALCSGTLIAPRVVLTAAHCVARRTAMRVIAGRKRLRVSLVLPHPEFSVDFESGLVHNDVALIFLRQAPAKPSLALLTSRRPQVNDVITITGYGLDEFGQVGTLRQGSAVLTEVTNEYLISVFDGEVQSNTCGGDSGGPAILGYPDTGGAERTGIVGITSAGISPTCAAGDVTFYIDTQAPAVLEFITANVPGVQLQ